MHEAEPNATYERARTWTNVHGRSRRYTDVREGTQKSYVCGHSRYMLAYLHADNLGSASYVHITSVHELTQSYTNVYVKLYACT